MTNPGPQSGLIIEVPEAEPVVGHHRERFDASGALGVPAHITVLFPFMPPRAINNAARAALARLFADISSFRFQLDHTDWFGDDVLWLGPRDPGPFRALTERVCEVFPAFRPYEGQFEDVVPHLTVGDSRQLGDLRAAETSVQARLPIEATAAAVSLITQRVPGGHWTRTASFRLG